MSNTLRTRSDHDTENTIQYNIILQWLNSIHLIFNSDLPTIIIVIQSYHADLYYVYISS